jgi:trk system potassium uptake protein TrkA
MKRQVAVIGLGRFGASAAQQLERLGFSVLAIDESRDAVEAIKDKVTVAVIADGTNPAELEAAGIRSCEIVVLAIGSEIEHSILAAMVLKELGIKRLVAKASTEFHGRLLKRVGVDEVVFPEHDMAVRLANRLGVHSLRDFLEEAPDYEIVESAVPVDAIGSTLKTLDYRHRYGVNVVGIRRGPQVRIDMTSDEPFQAGDLLLILGTVQALRRFTEEQNVHQPVGKASSGGA